MSVLFLMSHHNQTYKNAISSDSPFTHYSKLIRFIKNINPNKPGCIKNKFVLKSVLMNYLNK